MIKKILLIGILAGSSNIVVSQTNDMGLPSGEQVAAEAMAKAKADKERMEREVELQRAAEASSGQSGAGDSGLSVSSGANAPLSPTRPGKKGKSNCVKDKKDGCADSGPK